MPKVWTASLKDHAPAVRRAIMEATAKLAVKKGLASITMSEVAVASDIGRATLYKYFPDVEAILFAWHAEKVAAHLHQLAQVRDQAGTVTERLTAVLTVFAQISHQHHHAELAALVHRGDQVARAHRHLHNLVRGLLTEGIAAGEIRSDVTPDELATYCLHALSAASALLSPASVERLVAVTMSGLRRPKAARKATRQSLPNAERKGKAEPRGTRLVRRPRT
ncbi:MAG TPA: TetR/AcrR family transcriptional regulator [Polyangia bacterium]